MNKAEEEYKAKSTVSKRITFPKLFWDEFEADCKEGFNNTYHLKVQFDHEFRKQFQSISALLVQDLVEVKGQLFDLRAELEGLKLDKLTECTDMSKNVPDTGSQEPETTRKTFG